MTCRTSRRSLDPFPQTSLLPSLSIHPDGTIASARHADLDNSDLRCSYWRQLPHPSYHQKALPSLFTHSHFRRMDIHLLAPDSLSSVAIWDLRKQKSAHSIALGDDFKVNKVLYDTSAQFLGVAGSLVGGFSPTKLGKNYSNLRKEGK